MTALLILSLLSVGLLGMIFDSTADNYCDEDEDGGVFDNDSREGPPDLFLEDDNDDYECEVNTTNSSKFDEIDPGERIEDMFISLSDSTGITDNVLYGGAGDDFIRTSRLPEYDGVSSQDTFINHLGAGGNTVYGGVGNDIIEVSDDLAFGGAGDDTFIVISDPTILEMNEESTTISDFEIGNDIIFIQLPPESSDSENSDAPLSLHSELKVEMLDGNAVIMFRSTPILRLENIHQISLGVQEGKNQSFPISGIDNISNVRHLGLVDLDGISISGEPPDVIVSRYVRL